MGDHHPELSDINLIVRPGMVLNMIFKALKPFLHANTIAKIKFIKDKEMTEML